MTQFITVNVIDRQTQTKHNNTTKVMYEYGQKGKGKINKGEVMIKSCTLIERLNSLTSLVESPTVATSPSAGVRKGRTHRPKRLSLREKMSRVVTNVYLRETLEKTKKMIVCAF